MTPEYVVGSLIGELLIYGLCGFGIYKSSKYLVKKPLEEKTRKKTIIYSAILTISGVFIVAQVFLDLRSF